MQYLEKYLTIVEESLVKQNYSNLQPNNLYQPIDYILSLGGKRIRPVLTLWACELFGGKLEDAVNPALAVEVFHNFTLLHDDIMDNSDTRRGKPTVHIKYNENAAILSGDAMLIKAYQLIAKCKQEVSDELLNLFSTTAIEVCEGQQYDIDFESRSDVQIDEYIEMIRLKTAVLLAASLKIGAIIAGADKQSAAEIYNYGINLGLAFQLRDDYLDSFGDTETFGKKIGGDIRCGKKTYLLLKAFELAKGDDLEQLKSLIFENSAENNDVKVSEVLKIYAKYDLKSICERAIFVYFKEVVACVEKLQIADSQKDGLNKFAEDLMERNK